MGFEKRILDVISPALETGSIAEFYNGTLFLENVTDKTGNAVYNRLVVKLGKDKIRYSSYREGFIAIDFV